MQAYDLGDGYNVYDTGHHYTKGFDICFTKENQKDFFKAIDECNDKKIKEYLQNTADGETIRGGSLVKFDINGTRDEESAIIKLANKYNSLEPEYKEKAITILKDLLLAHEQTTLQHKKIISDDIEKAIDIIIEKHEDKNFAKNLVEICKTHYGMRKTHYGMQPDFRISYGTDSSCADVTKSEKLKSDLERLANSQKIITGLRMPQVGRKGAFMKYKYNINKKFILFPTIAGLRMFQVGRKGGFVKGKPTADNSDTERTNDLKPKTSPAITSSTSAVTTREQHTQHLI